MKSFPKTFLYHPVNILNESTGKNVKGFKFPVKDDKYDSTNAADIENLQQFQIYVGINQVISSIKDIVRTGTEKTNKIYKPLLDMLKEEYDKVCISMLSLASKMCWIPTIEKKKDGNRTYECKLTPERALYEIEPSIKSVLLAVQTIMDLTFPLELANKIRRFEIEKETLEIEEATGNIKKSLRK